MNRLYRYIFAACLVLFPLPGCVLTEKTDIGAGDGRVRLELFTRSTEYGAPVSRAAAEEFTALKDPWVLVFSGSGGTATLVEVQQAYEVGGRSFIELTELTGASQLLILANAQATFYVGSTSYAWADMATVFPSATLNAVCDAMLTVPLASPQTTVPFVGGTIPMSAIVELAGGIGPSTIIPDIEIGRPVAKVTVQNTDTNDIDGVAGPDFSLTGITAVINTPRQARLYNRTSSQAYNTVSGGTNLIEYRTDASYSADIAPAGTESTATNPVYLFDSETAADKNNTYIIIRATYRGEEMFYKMAFVDNDSGHANFERPLNVVRNTSYEFVITAVDGRGYSSVADAMLSKPSNTNLKYTVRVTDSSSFEIMANNDYYVGVTNSHFEVYAPADGFTAHTAFTLITDCTRTFATKNYVKSLTAGMTVTAPAGGVIPVNSTAPCEVKVVMDTGFTQGEIELHLGSMRKVVTVRRRDRVSNTTISSFIPDEGSTPYTYVSAYIDGYPVDGRGAPLPSHWLQLSPGSEAVRNDPHAIFVDDGRIDLHVGSGGTAGDVYVSTRYGTIRRIKVRVTQ